MCSAEGLEDGVLTAPSLLDAVRLLSAAPYAGEVETVFVIGGAAAFVEALTDGSAVVCDTLHYTRVFGDFDCDVHIPAIDDARYALTDFQVHY